MGLWPVEGDVTPLYLGGVTCHYVVTTGYGMFPTRSTTGLMCAPGRIVIEA